MTIREANTYRALFQHANRIKKKCKYCDVETGSTNTARHEKACYLNPKNLRLCPICSSPLKNWREALTCSRGCANIYTRQGIKNPNWEGGKSNYRDICFRYHERRCIICGEENFVEVHHQDKDHFNSKPENLIPLCILHHKYFHSKFKAQVEDSINNYISRWKKGGKGLIINIEKAE